MWQFDEPARGRNALNGPHANRIGQNDLSASPAGSLESTSAGLPLELDDRQSSPNLTMPVILEAGFDDTS
jgi:hypothetical protein